MKCPQCPVAAALACLGEVAPPLCRDVAHGKPGRAEQLLARAEGRPLPFDAAAHQAAKLLILGCDYRGPETTGSCGCAELRVCFAGKGREGTVVPADCRTCVAGGTP